MIYVEVIAMPIYCYRADDRENACDHCRETFEIVQKMSEEALTRCPQCGAVIGRIVTTFYSHTNKTKEMLSDKNLKEKGFTKLVREEKGVYRKVI